MPLVWTLTPPNDQQKQTAAKRRKVLVTGATGNIGTYFAEHAHNDYELYLLVRPGNEEAEALKPYGTLVEGTIDEIEPLKKICAGMDTILHLAGEASPSAVWESLLEANIIGSYNLFVAAKAAGCRRVIYASSIHAVSGYQSDVQVKTSDPVNPGDLYGVSKCFGEALGRYMAEQENLSVISLRIGAFQPIEAAQNEESIHMLDAFVSQRDLTQLIKLCIDDEKIRYAIFNGLSDNRFKRLDISDARELLGYAPQDDLTEENPRLKPLNLDDEVGGHSQKEDQTPSGIREEVGSKR